MVELNPLAPALPQYVPAIVLSQSYPSEFQRNILSQSFLSVFQRDIIVSRLYLRMIISSLLLGYSFINHQFHTKHNLARIPIGCFAGTTLPLHSPEFAESEIDLHLRKHD